MGVRVLRDGSRIPLLTWEEVYQDEEFYNEMQLRYGDCPVEQDNYSIFLLDNWGIDSSPLEHEHYLQRIRSTDQHLLLVPHKAEFPPHRVAPHWNFILRKKDFHSFWYSLQVRADKVQQPLVYPAVSPEELLQLWCFSCPRPELEDSSGRGMLESFLFDFLADSSANTNILPGICEKLLQGEWSLLPEVKRIEVATRSVTAWFENELEQQYQWEALTDTTPPMARISAFWAIPFGRRS